MSSPSDATPVWSTHTYKSVGGLALKLSVASPPPTGSPTPYIFFIHGGSFSAGDRFLFSAWCLGVARQLGWAFVTADYRLIPQANMADIVGDVRDAYDFVHQHLNALLPPSQQIDTSRAAVMAISAGGFMGMQLCLSQSHRPKAYVNIYGVSYVPLPIPAPPTVEFFNVAFPEEPVSKESFDKLLSDTKDSRTVRQRPCSNVRLHLGQLIGIPAPMWQGIALQNGFTQKDLAYTNWSSPSTKEDIARTMLGVDWAQELNEADFAGKGSLNPVQALDKSFPPTLSIHGEGDTLVPIEVSKKLTDKLRSLGIDTELLAQPGAEHMFDTPFGPQDDFVLQSVTFLKKHV